MSLYAVYIAGPMTGIPQFNFPAFDVMADNLRRAGYRVVSPAELDDPEDRAAALASPDGHMHGGHHMNKTWGDFLARDVKLIADGDEHGPIDGLVVLTGWERSSGARLETFVGRLTGKPIFYPYGANPTWDGLGRENIDLTPVPDIKLYRAWTAEPLLAIAATFGSVR